MATAFGANDNKNTWDSQNRLRQCVLNGTTSTFDYGADGLRQSKTANGVTTNYVLDGQNVAEDLQNGAPLWYLNGPRGIEYSQDTSSGKQELVSLRRPGKRRSRDRHRRERHRDTGLRCVWGGPRQQRLQLIWNTKFCGGLGHTTEPETGNLIYMRARWMDPATGRFISEDASKNGPQLVHVLPGQSGGPVRQDRPGVRPRRYGNDHSL